MTVNDSSQASTVNYLMKSRAYNEASSRKYYVISQCCVHLPGITMKASCDTFQCAFVMFIIKPKYLHIVKELSPCIKNSC